MPKISISKKYIFRASLHLSKTSHKSPQIFGHDFELEVNFEGKPDKDTGMLLQISALDLWMQKNILKKYDKCLLNKYFSLPTLENLSLAIFESLKESSWGTELKKICLKETSKNALIVRR